MLDIGAKRLISSTVILTGSGGQWINAIPGISVHFNPNLTFRASAVEEANQFSCTKISLDIPTGFDRKTGSSLFMPDIILTLAAMKTELLLSGVTAKIYLADIGISKNISNEFGIKYPEDFSKSNLLTYPTT